MKFTPGTQDDALNSEAPEGWRTLNLKDHTSHLHRIGPIFYQRDGEEKQLFAARVNPHNLNYAGHAHGGMLMSLADFAACSVAMQDASDVIATVSFNCEFIQPAPARSLLIVRVEPVRLGDSISFMRGQILCRKRIVLNFSATCKRMRRREKPRQIPKNARSESDLK